MADDEITDIGNDEINRVVEKAAEKASDNAQEAAMLTRDFEQLLGGITEDQFIHVMGLLDDEGKEAQEFMKKLLLAMGFKEPS
jgi:hypothetical protein